MQKMARKSSTVLPRMYSIALNCLVIFLMISRAASASQICDVVGQKYGTAIQELLDKVFTYDRLNLIILLDVSASIGYDLYRAEVETFAVKLVEYGTQKSGMIVHPEHAHIELVTFDDLANIQHNSSNPVHACEIYERLEAIKPGQFDGRTEVHTAFNATRELFRDRQRPGDQKVLFLVTDAGFTSPPAAVSTSVGQLRALGVEIFTIGVGAMSSSWVADNLNTVVLDELHFMCYSSWAEMMRWARDVQVTEVTWADVTASQEADRCPACTMHSSCKCAVNTQQYMCKCNTGSYLSSRNICQLCPGRCPGGELTCMTSCLPHQPDDEDEENDDNKLSKMTIIIVILGSILGLMMLMVLIMLVRWRRYKQSRDSTRSTGAQAFFNYIFLGKVINVKAMMGKEHTAPLGNQHPGPYSIESGHPSRLDVNRPNSMEIAQGVLMQIQAYEAMGEEDTATKQKLKDLAITEYPSQEQTDNTSYVHTACPRQSLASSHTYLSINLRSSLVDEEGYQRPVSYCVVEPSSECGEYENVTNLALMWIKELDRLVETTDLDGAAVFCKEDDSLATTTSFNVRPCDIGHILRLLDSGEQGAVFPMNGIMHQIRIHHKGSSLYAEEIPGGKDRGATWVINTEHYLVIGTGIRAMALTCEQSIGQFAVELEK